MGRHRKTMYSDPVMALISKLPIINAWGCERWRSIRPNAVYRFRGWYTEHDGRAITTLRILTTVSPTALIWAGLSIPYVLTVMLIGVFAVEVLSGKRERLRREQWKQELEREQREDERERRATDPLV